MMIAAASSVHLTPIIIPILAALIAIIPSAWAALSSRRMRREMDTTRTAELARNAIEQVYGKAYDRASRINAEIVAALREEIERLRKELDDLRAHAIAADRRNLDLERKYASMSRALDRMQALVNTYSTQLRELGVDIHHDDQEPGD